jgi:hypothetical protein
MKVRIWTSIRKQSAFACTIETATHVPTPPCMYTGHACAYASRLSMCMRGAHAFTRERHAYSRAQGHGQLNSNFRTNAWNCTSEHMHGTRAHVRLRPRLCACTWQLEDAWTCTPGRPCVYPCTCKGMRIGIQMIQWMHGFYELMHWRLSYARIWLLTKRKYQPIPAITCVFQTFKTTAVHAHAPHLQRRDHFINFVLTSLSRKQSNVNTWICTKTPKKHQFPSTNGSTV